ncbi:MFS transporter [Infirmifilum lucidum]|uniref:MFS transporter n=1 Tax=Infirmifilum lucidum TaxID=2776706 RepID=A0A7L9FIZ3_9CREN|nr:MFS transporter [Infirmifilum lucidum]QOJ78866.1 MFS transporter [Infirmifilum lucidum]
MSVGRPFMGVRSRELERSILALLLMGFTASLGSSIVAVVLQPYLKHLGLTPQDVGALQFAMSLATALALVPSAYLADTYSRKKVAVASLAFSAPGLLIVVFGGERQLLYLGFILVGVGNALTAVSLNPLLADVTPAEKLDAVSSISQVLGLTGASIGLALSWLPQLMASSTGSLLYAYRVFMLTGGAVSLASLLLLLIVREERRGLGGKSFQLAFSRETMLLSGLGAVIAFGAGASVWIINYYFMLKFGVEAGELGTRMLAETLLMIPATSAAPLVSARLGTLNAVLVLQSASIPLLLSTALAPDFVSAAALYTARSLLMNASNPLFWAFSMRLVGEEERSRYTMLNTLAWQVAGGAGSAVGGWLMAMNVDSPIYFTAAVYVVYLLLLYYLFRGTTRHL